MKEVPALGQLKGGCMITIRLLGALLDLVVIGLLRLILTWRIIPIALIALLVYSRYN